MDSNFFKHDSPGCTEIAYHQIIHKKYKANTIFCRRLLKKKKKWNQFSRSALFHNTLCTMLYQYLNALFDCTEMIRSIKSTEMLLWIPSHLTACNLKISWIVIFICVYVMYTLVAALLRLRKPSLYTARGRYDSMYVWGVCCQPLPPFYAFKMHVCVCKGG